MIISDEQAQSAIRYLRESVGHCHPEEGCLVSDGESSECMMVSKLKDHLMTLPDYREDRIAEAKRTFDETDGPSAEDIARKLIARFLTDAIR